MVEGEGGGFAAVMAVVYVLFSLLEMPVETLEAQLVAAQGGSAQLVAYSVVRSMLNWGTACFGTAQSRHL